MAYELCVRKPPESQISVGFVQKYEESSGRETTSFSYFFETAFSLIFGEFGQRGIGEIVLTRLSLI